MLERATFERELRELGLGGFGRAEHELLPARDVDHAAAEPLFREALRKRLGPLLSEKARDAAVAFNRANHPRVSEIELRDLRIRVANYIDQPTLEQALGAALDDEKLTAQLVHQFQQKCFRESEFHTGKLDEHTLDALGFVRHRGRALNKVDSGSAAALASIKKAWKDGLVDLGNDVTKSNWFSFMVDPPYLGLTIIREPGVHLELIRRLRIAQRYLMGLPQYRDLSPVELGDRLLWDPADDPPPRPSAPAKPKDKFGDRHRGARRPATITTPMHPAGLAIDLAYRSNPYVGNATFKAVTKRAGLLIGGPTGFGGVGLGASDMGKLGSSGLSTGAIYDELSRWNGCLEQYFALERSDADLRAVLAARLADGTPDVLRPRETEAQQFRRWRKQISDDKELLRASGGFLRGRDPAKGFLSLHRDLVIALRDHGCLAWGGCDFHNGSGDIMHFDCRADGIGRAYLSERGGDPPTSHPCIGRPKPQQIDMELKPVKLDAKLGGKLYRLTSRRGGATTAIYVPAAVKTSDPLCLIVWIHGDLICGGEGANTLTLVKSAEFPLVQLLAASGKPFVLVAPSMPWASDGSSHPLAAPKAMSAFLDEVRGELTGAGWAAAPQFARVILAGHSRAYVVLNGLARQHAAREWSQPGLAHVSDFWLFDTSYGKKHKQYHCDNWLAFLKAKPRVTVRQFYREATSTAPVAECLRDGAARDGLTNLITQGFDRRKLEHCPMPRELLPELLKTS